MNFDTAKTRLQSRGFDYLNDDQLGDCLNTAQRIIDDAYTWPWLEGTASGDSPLEIADLCSVLSVTDTTNDSELLPEDVRTLRAWDRALDDSGPPINWWLSAGTTVTSWPTDTVTLSVRYIKFSPELATGDTPLFPARYHGLWLDLATIEAYKEAGNWQAVQVLGVDATLRLAQMVDVYASQNLQAGITQYMTGASEDG